jgi:hypothetical protein
VYSFGVFLTITLNLSQADQDHVPRFVGIVLGSWWDLEVKGSNRLDEIENLALFF